jgi:hypothetical protein
MDADSGMSKVYSIEMEYEEHIDIAKAAWLGFRMRE